MDTTMQNKICLVTGGTSGIGYETAMGLAKMGATVIIGGRDMEKTANTVIKIRTESNNPYIDFLLADLSNFEETRKFAAEFKNQYSRLDVLVNNAGAMYKEYDANPDRVEMTMALNFFSPYLLTGLLLDRLQTSTPSRIINVSSMMHQMARNNFSEPVDEVNYKPLNAYALSKLTLLHFTYKLAEKLQGTGVTVNAMHPGWVKSNFGSDFYKGFYGIINTISKPIQATPQQGADTIIYLASSAEIEKISGKYFIKRKAVNSSTSSYDKQASAIIWDLAERTCNFKYSITDSPQNKKEEEKKADLPIAPSEDKTKDI